MPTQNIRPLPRRSLRLRSRLYLIACLSVFLGALASAPTLTGTETTGSPPASPKT